MTKKLFSFGLITDIQYADIDNGYNYQRTSKRYYRKGLACLGNAIANWNSNKVDFVLQLGDMIDGKSHRNNKATKDLKQLRKKCDKFQGYFAHCCGNHELYNISRDEYKDSFLYPKIQTNIPISETKLKTLYSSDSLTNANLCAYHFSPHPGFRFIVLDCYDISPLGREPTDERYMQGMAILEKHNKNDDKNDPPRVTSKLKYVKYNGGISQEQLIWLDEVLTYSDSISEKVIISGHISLKAESCSEMCVIWNNQDVLDVLYKHESVAAYFSGHDHEMHGYYLDEKGIHHRSFASVIETPPASKGGKETAFAIVNVFADKLEIQGHGEIESGDYTFSN